MKKMKEKKRAKAKRHRTTTRKKRSREITNKRRRRKTAPKNREPKGASRSRRIFHQCLLCGAEVDQKFGAGEGSWCPHCYECNWVIEEIGQLPDPQMYGSWRLEQEKIKRKVAAAGLPPGSRPPPINVWQQVDREMGKTYTGIYTCLKCHCEFNLIAEDSSICNECGGFMMPGAYGWAWNNKGGRSD